VASAHDTARVIAAMRTESAVSEIIRNCFVMSGVLLQTREACDARKCGIVLAGADTAKEKGISIVVYP